MSLLESSYCFAACSSSALALHDAIADLTAGRCDYALVGGASSILRPATSVAFNKLHMLSPDGICKSFSADANGWDSETCSSAFASVYAAVFCSVFRTQLLLRYTA